MDNRPPFASIFFEAKSTAKVLHFLQIAKLYGKDWKVFKSLTSCISTIVVKSLKKRHLRLL